jgi:broad specificity phosphatase PhoE
MERSRTLLVAAAFLALAPAAHAQQEVILVRHAELQGAAMADAKSLSLSPDGKARAQRLAGMLKDSGVGAIYVSEFARTMQTADPLSREIGRKQIVVPKSESPELAERLRKEQPGQVVLLVGHTDTLPGLIRALGGPQDVKIDAKDYGNIFILTPKAQGAPGFLRMRY